MSVPSKLAGALADEEGIDSVAGVAEDVAAGREGLELWAPREALELMALGLAAGFGGDALHIALGTAAVICGMVNVVGGYLVTDRMLRMFKKK